MPEGVALPQKIGRYDVKRLLATGTMGDVYQATTLDERTRVPVYHTIKVLNPKIAKKLNYVARFKAEIKDDCLLEYREVDFDSKVQDYFVSDYLEVRPVSRAVLRRERSTEILELFVRVANAVDKAQRKGYVHGNIKTTNFLIRRGKDENGKESVWPILSDYGLTYLYNADYFSGARFRSTFPYMSPEKIESLVSGSDKNDGVSAASDVYSLAVVLAETLSGSLPFGEAETLDACRKVKREKRYLMLHVNHPVRRVDIRRLNDVLRRSLHPDPGGRYASAAEFAAALASCRLEAATA
jgi:serine/threonine-protein kinase